eukprot:2868921-Amphidinium_carterae.2
MDDVPEVTSNVQRRTFGRRPCIAMACQVVNAHWMSGESQCLDADRLDPLTGNYTSMYEAAQGVE